MRDAANSWMTSDVQMFAAILRNGRKRLSPMLARHLLTINFSKEDRHRMDELLERSQEGALTQGEQEELDRYGRVGCWVSILHSKARQALKRTAKRQTSA